MKGYGLFRFILTLILAIIMVLSCSPAMAAELPGHNRFNVVIVLDASGSMRKTDPYGYRYRAITQFANLLAEQGNRLGGVVFHTDVVEKENAKEALTLLQSQKDKKTVTDMLESIPADGDWTNIGAGLSRAVSMIAESGDPALPSVILLLSDGNTDMETQKEKQDSLDQKAEAIQAAREQGIAIYSVCLNANQTADLSEMQQISNATGGVFQEVTVAEDLQEVFNTSYELIYGTSTIPLFSGTFPASGQLETTFDVPGLGVEEVNIIIYGDTSKLRLIQPNGIEGNAAQSAADTFFMIKQVNPLPGTWTLITEGIPGNDIKINMLYNTNLEIDVSIDPDAQSINPADPVTFKARLAGNNVIASNSQQYIGYSAELVVTKAFNMDDTNGAERIPMQVVDDHFEVEHSFEEGTYYYAVAVSGNHINKESEREGPLTSTNSTISEAERNNTPPTPVEDIVETTIKIWPFRGGSYTLDMNTLAEDAQDDTLQYQIESSSFLEGTDYTVDEAGVLHMDHFSLSKGAFTIRATDSGGLSCKIEVIVHAFNIGVLALIGLGILVLVVVSAVGILIYLAIIPPFRGTISAQSYCNGSFKGTSRNPRRGRCKLAVFGMDNVGLNYQKCYFQATGKNYIELNTNVPVFWNGQGTKKVRISSGTEVVISIQKDDSRRLYIRFDSRMRNVRKSGVQNGPAHSGRR